MNGGVTERHRMAPELIEEVAVEKDTIFKERLWRLSL